MDSRNQGEERSYPELFPKDFGRPTLRIAARHYWKSTAVMWVKCCRSRNRDLPERSGQGCSSHAPP